MEPHTEVNKIYFRDKIQHDALCQLFPTLYVIYVCVCDRLFRSWPALCSGEILSCWHLRGSDMSSRHLHPSSRSNKLVYIPYDYCFVLIIHHLRFYIHSH